VRIQGSQSAALLGNSEISPQKSGTAWNAADAANLKTLNQRENLSANFFSHHLATLTTNAGGSAFGAKSLQEKRVFEENKKMRMLVEKLSHMLKDNKFELEKLKKEKCERLN